MAFAASAEVDFALRMVFDHEACAAQHGLDRSAVRDEPVARVRGVAFFDEEQLGIIRSIEDGPFGKIVVFLQIRHTCIAALEALEQEPVPNHMLEQEIERQKRVAQVIEHAHENDEIELLLQPPHLIDRHLMELDVEARVFGCEACLAQIMRIGIDADDPACIAPLHFQRVEAGIAADIENAAALEVIGDDMPEALPLEPRIVAKEVIGGRLDATDPQVVEPGAELGDPLSQLRIG